MPRRKPHRLYKWQAACAPLWSGFARAKAGAERILGILASSDQPGSADADPNQKTLPGWRESAEPRSKAEKTTDPAASAVTTTISATEVHHCPQAGGAGNSLSWTRRLRLRRRAPLSIAARLSRQPADITVDGASIRLRTAAAQALHRSERPANLSGRAERTKRMGRHGGRARFCPCRSAIRQVQTIAER